MKDLNEKSEPTVAICANCKKEFTEGYFDYCSPTCRNELDKKRWIHDSIEKTIPSKFKAVKTGREIILNKGLFCYGTVGTGKTQYIAEVVREYIERIGNKRTDHEDERFAVKPPVWLSCPVFIMQAQSMYRDKNQDPFGYIIDIAKRANILVLDDIGMEKMSDWVRQVLYMLINERYQRESITLITSNRNLKEIDELIHPGIASRIAGMCEVIHFSGKDFRVSK